MIDQYRQAFQEEARELLAELESALLELDRDRENQDLVGRAFRALHTIKGSGAMFGFERLAAFTHHVETAFDQLRNGKLDVTADLIALALGASDQIKTLLDQEQTPNAVTAGDAAVNSGRAEEILAGLRQLTGIAEMEAAAALAPQTMSEAAAYRGAAARSWRIRFRPPRDILANGTNPLRLLAELRELGALEVQVDVSEVPALSEIDPERCYLAWNLVLETSAPVEAIRDVFIFVEDSSELAIEPLAPAASAAGGPGVSAASGQRTQAAPTAKSIRVSAEKLDQLINVVGELVTVQARLSAASARTEDAELQEIAEVVERLSGELRENSMSIRMLPLRTTFERFRRLVHDLGIDLGKEVELEIEGAETELDKTVIDQLNDPLVHLIRNSMDHGIETPDVRMTSGKPAKARIRLAALHSGAHVLIRVSDDGRGLDAEVVRARAIERGLIEAGARLSESELFALILEPGFSTAREVTDLSGRGVGMDVVRRSVEALHGSIEISNRPGRGLTVTLRLPLTLAIIDGLLVRVGEAYFVLPLANSLECVELTRRDIEAEHGNHLAKVRGELVPYIRLGEYFGMGGEAEGRETGRPEQIMVVETEYGRYGFVVDEVLGDHQTVIKNLGKAYRNVQEISGATILGTGAVALILDPHRLVGNAIQKVSADERRRKLLPGSGAIERPAVSAKPVSAKPVSAKEGAQNEMVL
ncbi:MAG TPA: chemotaxis protein CheA [Bryobacteraceae bacterium]|nr:chemotaxis protein CheA [Bryobacteraceae bacterium]